MFSIQRDSKSDQIAFGLSLSYTFAMTTHSTLILPKETPTLEEGKPVYFLAGPVRGGGNWQRDAFERISKEDPHSYVVCPWRYTDDDPIRMYELKGSERVFESQTAWERYYLELAGRTGCVLFWLPVQDLTNPRAADAGPYGQETYGELGEWRARKYFDPATRLVIGADEQFPGLGPIRRNYEAMIGKDFIFYSSLEETVRAAIIAAHTS